MRNKRRTISVNFVRRCIEVHTLNPFNNGRLKVYTYTP